MKFYHSWALTRDGEEVDVQLEIQCSLGCRATRESPAEPDDYEVVGCIDTRYGSPVELTDEEENEILDLAPEWAGDACAENGREYNER